MKLFIPYVELKTDDSGSQDFIHFQKLVAMMSAFDHYLRPIEAISFTKSMEKTLQNTGVVKGFDEIAYQNLVERVRYQLTTLERFVSPMLNSVGLSDQEQISNTVLIEATYQPDGWLVNFSLNQRGSNWARLYRETQ